MFMNNSKEIRGWCPKIRFVWFINYTIESPKLSTRSRKIQLFSFAHNQGQRMITYQKKAKE